MCPHCLNQPGGCVHCTETPLRPPTETSIQNFALAAVAHGVTKSCLTNDDRAALGIFQKPWRGVAARHPRTVREHRVRQAAVRQHRPFNTISFPAGFTLA